MRVLSILHYNGFGGPHNRNMRVIPLLETRGIHTTVLLPNEPGNAAQRLSERGIEIVQIPLGRVRRTLNPLIQAKCFGSYLREVPAIRRIIRERRIDLVQVNGFGNPPLGEITERESRLRKAFFRRLLVTRFGFLPQLIQATRVGYAFTFPQPLILAGSRSQRSESD